MAVSSRCIIVVVHNHRLELSLLLFLVNSFDSSSTCVLVFPPSRPLTLSIPFILTVLGHYLFAGIVGK